MSIFEQTRPHAATAAEDSRLPALEDWLCHALGKAPDALRPASSDASFRRYFRVFKADSTYIAMDAPPPMEDVRPFVRIAGLMRHAGVCTPGVHAADEEHGFLLLDDFGSENYLDRLDPATADGLYGDALESLARLQTGVDVTACGLPDYDETLLRNEMNLFRDWFLGKLLGLPEDEERDGCLDRTWRRLIDSALEQPRVCVHRDYHSRNLMVTAQDNPGVLDFQDAVVGPLTYDLVSLLRDCYVAWPQERLDVWVAGYHQRLRDLGFEAGDREEFTRWFDLMGVQRHLKAIGIFARLKLRDGKGGYLKDIPRTLNYVVTVAQRYPALSEFVRLLQDQVLDKAGTALGEAA